MAIEFPANPAAQTPANTFSPTSTPLASPNDVTYTWDGEKWEAYKKLDPSDFDDLFVEVAGDDMTGNLTLGTDKIVLDAGAGSATFAGKLFGGLHNPNHPGEASLNISGANNTKFIQLYDRVNATNNSFIYDNGFLTYDGSAKFAGDVQVGDNVDAANTNIGAGIAPLGIYKARRNNNDILWYGYQTGRDTETSRIRADGSAQFDGDIESTSQNGGPLAGFRNQLINGDFRIWQRGSVFPGNTIFSDYFTADRWTKRVEASTRVDRVPISDLPGFNTGIAFTAGYMVINQPIELNETGNAAPFVAGSTWTISFWGKSTVPESLTLEYGFADSSNFLNAPGNTVVTDAFNLTNSWQRHTQTVTIPNNIASTNKCLIFEVNNSISNDVFITGVQLEPGPVATPFEHRPIGTELALCQRYYQTYSRLWAFYRNKTGTGPSVDTINVNQVRAVVMRVKPTETFTTFATSASTGSSTASTIDIEGNSGDTQAGVIFNDYTADAEL